MQGDITKRAERAWQRHAEAIRSHRPQNEIDALYSTANHLENMRLKVARGEGHTCPTCGGEGVVLED